MLPFKGDAEVAAGKDAPYPFKILHEHRVIEAEALTQLRRGILIDDFVRCRKRRYICRDVISRRQLDKRKGKEADGEKGWDHP